MLRSSKPRGGRMPRGMRVVNAGFLGLTGLIALNHAFRKDARVTAV
ncbi:hypothetical protein SAMN05444170_4892 [Bradyrhizobium erythrophlei]|jgi:hypothetical protein|uniref:Uncharacterized protein n=1 Tax=Bradyrhizobium erythrophlei TaxID=1437360 RepID=A0A1M7UFE8_9BRAD|nr:hypothetical protein SAMN05444170_4892 [Bradyrhizobium erythrophlei]